MVTQLILAYLLTYPRNICIDEPFDKDKDKEYWIYMDNKFEVITVKMDKEFYLRIIIFLFDLVFFLCEGLVIVKLERIKANKCSIMSISCAKYIINGYLIFWDFSRNYCENSKNDKNLFYIKNNVLEKISILIFDIIKFIIN